LISGLHCDDQMTDRPLAARRSTRERKIADHGAYVQFSTRSREEHSDHSSDGSSESDPGFDTESGLSLEPAPAKQGVSKQAARASSKSRGRPKGPKAQVGSASSDTKELKYKYLSNATPLRVTVNTPLEEVLEVQAEVEAVVMACARRFDTDPTGLKQLTQMDIVSSFLEPIVNDLLALAPSITKAAFERYLVTDQTWLCLFLWCCHVMCCSLLTVSGC